MAAAESPLDAKVLGPLTRKEIHHRLARSPIGGMLGNLVVHEHCAALVARAIETLQRDFRSPVAVSDLAGSVGMSVSAFHRHFKAVTSLSPLQYQKELRLLEARRRLRAGATSASATAFEVGYESQPVQPGVRTPVRDLPANRPATMPKSSTLIRTSPAA